MGRLRDAHPIVPGRQIAPYSRTGFVCSAIDRGTMCACGQRGTWHIVNDDVLCDDCYAIALIAETGGA